jgi:hypothetical protein
MNKNVVFAITRHVMNTVGVILVAKGLADEDTAASVIGAVHTLVAFVWSIIDKRNQPKP